MESANGAEKAVILLSGGIDSSTVLALARERGYELYALSLDYHQRHKRELESAQLVADSYSVQNHLVIRFDLSDIGGSALTSGVAVPKKARTEKPEDLAERSRHAGRQKKHAGEMHNASFPLCHSEIPATYVPARNTIFLSFALAWAEVLNAEHIFIGANAVDYSGYPDCRPEYLRAFEHMANLGTRASVERVLRYRVHAPLIFMKKSEIIKRGVELGLDYGLTWSCYDPQSRKHGEALPVRRKKKNEKTLNGLTSRFRDVAPCGECDSCRFRAKGFREAGITDPLIM